MKLSSLKNIGKTLEAKLNQAGIADAEAFFALGSIEAFTRLRKNSPGVCLVHLYALQAALDGTPISDLPEATKKELKSAYNKITQEEGLI